MLNFNDKMHQTRFPHPAGGGEDITSFRRLSSCI